jgi:hypothetical protein
LQDLDKNVGQGRIRAKGGDEAFQLRSIVEAVVELHQLIPYLRIKITGNENKNPYHEEQKEVPF